MTGWRRGLVVAAGLAVGMAAMLPLRLVLDNSGVAARAVNGSIWHGQVAEAQFHGVALGDMNASLAALPLMTGELRLKFAGDAIRGELMQRRGGGGIAGVAGWLMPAPIAGVPIGRVDMDGVSIAFDAAGCQTATGRISINPGGLLAGIGPLQGVPRCIGPQVQLRLLSRGGAGSIALLFGRDGHYHATITVADTAVGDQQALLAAGFQPTRRGLGLIVEGRL